MAHWNYNPNPTVSFYIDENKKKGVMNLNTKALNMLGIHPECRSFAFSIIEDGDRKIFMLSESSSLLKGHSLTVSKTGCGKIRSDSFRALFRDQDVFIPEPLPDNRPGFTFVFS